MFRLSQENGKWHYAKLAYYTVPWVLYYLSEEIGSDTIMNDLEICKGCITSYRVAIHVYRG